MCIAESVLWGKGVLGVSLDGLWQSSRTLAVGSEDATGDAGLLAIAHVEAAGLQPTVLNHNSCSLEHFGAKNNTIEANSFIVMSKAEGADSFHRLLKISNHAVIVLQ